VELLVRVVHDRCVVPIEHVIVEHAVRLGVHSGGHGEVVDERLSGERASHVRRRCGCVPEPGQCRRHLWPDIIGPETVERHDHRHRVSADGRHSGRCANRGDQVTLQSGGRRPVHDQRRNRRLVVLEKNGKK